MTLPLHEGRTTDGRVTWYVVSESSDQADATRRGVNYSNKLLNAVGTAAVQKGRLDGDGELVFEGTVNFGLTYVLVPGPNGFPPTQFAPGAEGDAKYSPLVQIVPSRAPPAQCWCSTLRRSRTRPAGAAAWWTSITGAKR